MPIIFYEYSYHSYKKNIFLYFLIGLFGFLLVYHLDYNTLVSWDEAWYASIARDMFHSGEYMFMNWNGKPFFDHPPMGFWLMSLSYRIFGVNEFGARFPSVLLGVLSIVLLFKIAEELFHNKFIGFAAGLILGSSVWFVLRARSGNLDIIFAFFFLLTIYTAIRSSKEFKFFPLVGIAFGMLILSKTLIGISALPLIFVLNFFQLIKPKNIPYTLTGILLSMAIITPWYHMHKTTYSEFWQYHFYNIGTRNREFSSYLDFSPAKQSLFYLHMGIRKWYYIWLASLIYVTVRLKFIKKEVLFLLLWNFVLLFPFLSSAESHIWHLIPVYLPVALLIAYSVHDGVFFAKKLFGKYITKNVKKLSFIARENVIHGIYLVFFLLIAIIQIKIFWPEVIPANKYAADNIAISRAAGKYNQKIFLDDGFFPTAVFYSGKRIIPMYDAGSWGEADDKKTLVGLFNSDQDNFIVITRSWAVDNLKNEHIEYKILEKNKSFVIVTKP